MIQTDHVRRDTAEKYARFGVRTRGRPVTTDEDVSRRGIQSGRAPATSSRTSTMDDNDTDYDDSSSDEELNGAVDECYCGVGTCKGCGNDTENGCDMCGTPLCSDQCAECAEHTEMCAALHDEGLVGVSFNRTEIDNITRIADRLVLRADAIALLETAEKPRTNVERQYQTRELRRGDKGYDTLAYLLSKGIRIFVIPAADAFSAKLQDETKPTGLWGHVKAAGRAAKRGLEWTRKTALRSKAEAFAYRDGTRKAFPAIVIFGHRKTTSSTRKEHKNYVAWPESYMDSLRYVAKLQDRFYAAAKGALKKEARGGPDYTEWVQTYERSQIPAAVPMPPARSLVPPLV
jgi:hypothetical protein